jgi:hypothetical protein
MARVRTPLLLAVLVLMLALAAGCGGGPALVAQPTTLQGLAASAQRSSDASSGRYAFSVTTSMPGLGDGFEITGEGAFETATGKTSMSLDLSALLELFRGFAEAFGGSSQMGDLDSDDFQLDAILDGTDMYMRFPFLRDQIPGGKEWLKLDLLQAAASTPGLDLDQVLQFTKNGPQSTLSYLEALSGDIETVGAEEVRGVATTHHRATVDVRKYASLVPAAERERLSSMLDGLVDQVGLEAFPVDVWVGTDGLVRKVELALSMTQPGTTRSVSASMSYEMFDYGEPVTITLPLPDQVADVTSLGP